jgi:hypothetical protein
MNHEGMVSLFAMISLTAFAVYLFNDRRALFLILSGLAGGLAQLTKSNALAMAAGMGVLLLVHFHHARANGRKDAFPKTIKPFLVWLAVLAFSYFILWPGMWVAPGKMLYQVYGNAFSYALQGSRLTIAEELDASRFSLNTNLEEIREMVKVFFFRTTPLTWIGILLGFSLPFARDREAPAWTGLFVLLLTINAAAFLLLIGIAQGRNSPHYILSSYLSLNLLAGLGWYFSLARLLEPFSFLRRFGHLAALSLAMLAQSWSAVSAYPYYFTYRNPVLVAAGWYADFPQFPYGEGLELAARHLAELPGAPETTVFSYYSRGCFSYFYPGKAISFRPYYVDGDHAGDLLDNLRASDYLVVYYANQGQLPHYGKFLAVLSTIEPVKVIWLDGYEYIRIYDVGEFPPEIFEALAQL